MVLTQKQFWSNVDVRGPNDYWPWLGNVDSHGYGIVAIRFKGKSMVTGAHRAALIFYTGKNKKHMLACHKRHCRQLKCCNPHHLYWGTKSQNAYDMVALGRHGLHLHPGSRAYGLRNARYTHPENTARGSGHGMHKLVEDEVREIRILRENHFPCSTIASMFSVTTTNIKYIVSRKTWRHI